MLINYIFTLESVFKLVLPKTQNQLDKPVCFTHTIVLLIYVNETIYLPGNLSFFKIRINRFMARDDSPCANVISKCTLWVRDLASLWVLRHFLSLIKQPASRTDVEAETPILWPPHAKSWLTGKDPDAGRDWGQEEKGTTEDEMAGWHHRLDGHEFE